MARYICRICGATDQLEMVDDLGTTGRCTACGTVKHTRLLVRYELDPSDYPDPITDPPKKGDTTHA